MKIELLVVGKTNDSHLNNLFEEYEKRLKHYLTFKFTVIPELKNTKNLSVSEQKEKEADLILKSIEEQDHVILLDEHGKEYSSVEFSLWLEKLSWTGTKKLIFIIGGPFGFSQRMYERAKGKISLSRMTFSHQMIRVFFIEQIYRAMTIQKGEPYHNE